MIVSSFAAQYGIRLSQETEMSWGEFCSLLCGLMSKTPLGQIVSIRSEDDKDILKHFTQDQHKIRNEWRMRSDRVIDNLSEEEKEENNKKLQEMFAKIFN